MLDLWWSCGQHAHGTCVLRPEGVGQRVGLTPGDMWMCIAIGGIRSRAALGVAIIAPIVPARTNFRLLAFGNTTGARNERHRLYHLPLPPMSRL